MSGGLGNLAILSSALHGILRMLSGGLKYISIDAGLASSKVSQES